MLKIILNERVTTGYDSPYDPLTPLACRLRHLHATYANFPLIFIPLITNQIFRLRKFAFSSAQKIARIREAPLQITLQMPQIRTPADFVVKITGS